MNSHYLLISGNILEHDHCVGMEQVTVTLLTTLYTLSLDVSTPPLQMKGRGGDSK